MNAIKVTKTLTQPIPELPELNGVLGAEVEIIVLVKHAEDGVRVRQAGTGRGHVTLDSGWDDPIDDFRDFE